MIRVHEEDDAAAFLTPREKLDRARLTRGGALSIGSIPSRLRPDSRRIGVKDRDVLALRDVDNNSLALQRINRRRARLHDHHPTIISHKGSPQECSIVVKNAGVLENVPVGEVFTCRSPNRISGGLQLLLLSMLQISRACRTQHDGRRCASWPIRSTTAMWWAAK
jgi:hypothetical protein